MVSRKAVDRAAIDASLAVETEPDPEGEELLYEQHVHEVTFTHGRPDHVYSSDCERCLEETSDAEIDRWDGTYGPDDEPTEAEKQHALEMELFGDFLR